MPRERIDRLIVDRGLAPSRTRAQALVLAGQVFVRDQRVDKPGQMVDTAEQIRILGETPRYVSRGGIKLEAALREFGIDPGGKFCLDVGASTGGFTDCLLQHGAAGVDAVDVGRNQLAWRMRQDPRVRVHEGINARRLDPESFAARFDLATIDVSFISLSLILPAVRSVLAESADCLPLVKPQFEVGKGEVGAGGIVTDPLKHRAVLSRIAREAEAAGFSVRAVIASPILGAEGNREFFLHLSTVGDSAADLEARIDALTGTDSPPFRTDGLLL